MLSEELATALGERVDRSELRKVELATGLLKALKATIRDTESEMSPEQLKKANAALSAGEAFTAAFVKERWPKGSVPRMNTSGPRSGVGTHKIRSLITALGDAIDKMGDPANSGLDDVVDVKFDQAKDAIFVKRPRIQRPTRG